MIEFGNAAVVVAHPDDEVLWFGSLVRRVGRIVICYSAISPESERAARRREAMRAYPLDTLMFLDLPIPNPAEPQQAEAASAVLADRLAAALDGVATVFTHNAWGEYGQADHRRVHGAIEALRERLDFTMYVSAYAARYQLAEVARHVKSGVAGVLSLPVDRSEIASIVGLYKSFACWTWSPFWRWPRQEHFLHLGRPDGVLHYRLLVFGGKQAKAAPMRGLLPSLFTARCRQVHATSNGAIGRLSAAPECD